MQKKLIALAVAGAFAAPAFAATSNVDVYGQINMSVERVDNGDTAVQRMVSNNNSFIGVKGSEDLGGGLSAVWQIEANLNTDGNGSTGNYFDSDNTKQSAITANNNIFGTRNTYVGLSSKTLGTVIAGVHDTPYKMSTGGLDIFVGTLGDYNAIFGSGGTRHGSYKPYNPSAVFDLRTGNTIAYMSPNFDGFEFKAAYVMGAEASVTSSRSSAYSLSGSYTNGPLFLTAAYERHNNVNGYSPLYGNAFCNNGAVCLGEGDYDMHAYKFGAGYTIAGLKLGAIYEKIVDDEKQIGHTSWGVNAAYPVGAMTLKAEYLKGGSTDYGAGDSGAKMIAVGVDYALSKRTVIQLTYADLENQENGYYALGQGPQVTPTTSGAELSGYSIGVRHSF